MAADDTERAPRLALVDDVCATALRRAAPLRFAEVASPVERRALFALRHRTVVEEGWASLEDAPDGLERDGYDVDAVQLGGYDGDSLIATARLVLPQAGRPLPTELAFELEVEPPGEAVDFGRLVVERSHRGGSLTVLGGMLACAWIAIRRRGFSRFCAADTRAMIRLYRMTGFTVEVLAPARPYWRAERYPVLFDLAASADGLTRQMSRLDGLARGATAMAVTTSSG